MKFKNKVTYERLTEILDYNSKTGKFTWKVKMRRRKMLGKYAGTGNSTGYIHLGIDQVIYKAHRLAWFYYYREWPRDSLDHVNGNKSDNRIKNLRLADHSLNQANSKLRKNNKCGFKGVYFHRHSGLYASRITVNYKNLMLGYYKSPEEAHAAYLVGAKRYFGEFARAA